MNKLKGILSVEASFTTVAVDLHDGDSSYPKGTLFEVWVTPTRGHLSAFNEYRDWVRENITLATDLQEEDAERLNAEMYARFDAWLAETWRNFDADEVTQLREHLQETNPGVWDWLYNETLKAMADYREGLVKN